MSQYKNNPDFTLYYTDTDSYFLGQTLPPTIVDNKKLGMFKLERTLTDFVSLGPKVYGGKTLEGDEFTKVKGLKTSLKLSDLKELLNKNLDYEIIQTKKE